MLGLKGKKGKWTSLGKGKGKEQLKRPQESKTGLDVFVENPLPKNLPPIVNLNALRDFTPSKPSYIVGPTTFPFNVPKKIWDSIWTYWSTPPYPSPRVLPCVRPPRWQCKVFPFSKPSIMMERISFGKWPKE